MDPFARHLAAHAPLIWVQSDEARRVYDYLQAHAGSRPVLRMDWFEGLECWDQPQQAWLLVVDPDAETDENGKLTAIKDLTVAFAYAAKVGGIFVIENAHLLVERIVGMLGYLSRKWMDAFYADDLDAMGASIVMISCNDQIPPEIARATIKVSFELPDATTLDGVVDYLVTGRAARAPSGTERVQLVKAALGLTEYEAANALYESVDEQRRMDWQYVNGTKLRSLARDGLLEIRPPSVTLDDVGGLDKAKEILGFAIWIWNHPAEAAELEVEPLRRILLVGVQGAGKSLLCEAAADGLGHDLVKFSLGNMMNKFVGESEANIRRAMAQIKVMAPLTLWMDEFGRDLSGSHSSSHSDSGTTDRVHGTFLSGLQELPDNVFMVAAANRINTLPPEMLRADRMDKILFVGFPTQIEREDIWRIHLGNRADDYDLAALADASICFTGAEIKAAVREVRVYCAGRAQRRPRTKDLLDFLPTMRHRVWLTHHDEITEMYRRAQTDWTWASSGQEAEAKLILNQRREGGGKIRPVAPSSSRPGDLWGAGSVSDL